MPAIASVEQYFDTLSTRFVASAAKGVEAVFQYEISGEGGGTWAVTVKDGAFSVASGAATAPAVTVKMGAADYVKLANGEINGMMAYMKGLMKVTGNLGLAKKMQDIFPPGKK